MNENDKSVKDTMEIIINAGDARELISEALDNVADFDYKAAEGNMEKAKEKPTKPSAGLLRSMNRNTAPFDTGKSCTGTPPKLSSAE